MVAMPGSDGDAVLDFTFVDATDVGDADGVMSGINLKFENINRMAPEPQQTSLELIRELWMMYITHYNVMGGL